MDTDQTALKWKSMYRLGALCGVLVLILSISEMLLTALPAGSRVASDFSDGAAWLVFFENNTFMALRNLGLINILASTLMIPVFFSLFGLYIKENVVFAGFSLVLFLVSYAVFMADNTALAMLSLSNKWQQSPDTSQRLMLESAAEAMIARGRSHTAGTFPGFLLSEISSMCMSLVILQGGFFKKVVGLLGLVAFSCMLVFEVVLSFISGLAPLAMYFAMAGGVLALIWYFLLTRGLWQASSK